MRRPVVLMGLAVMLAALNLRAPVASVGPVLPELRADLGLSGIGAAVVTALPVLCFGLLAVVAPRWAGRAGIEPVLVAALVLLAIGLGSRVWGGANLLLAGTLVVGGSIAIANVLLPPLIKRDFRGGTGVMMGLYTTCLAVSAALGAGITVPAGEAIGEGWRGALWIWAVPALLAAMAWRPMLRIAPGPSPHRPAPGSSIARRPLAWQVTVFFGLQSLVFYAVLAWLPSIYRAHGYSPAAAGFLLSLCGLVQIPVTLLLPRLAIRAANQVPHIAASTAFMGAGLLGILVAPTLAPYLWVTLLGIGCGACFAMGLALFVLRTGPFEDTARLSGMAQSIGYLICACGPLLFGLVHDLTGSWNASLALLLVLLLPQLYMGVLAGRARVLHLPVRQLTRFGETRELVAATTGSSGSASSAGSAGSGGSGGSGASLTTTGQAGTPQTKAARRAIEHEARRRPASDRLWVVCRRGRIRELERENHELHRKVEFLSKTVNHLCARNTTTSRPDPADADLARATSD
ncbi:MAG TPA: MFS transporter [Pseudonocardiaceae bacterium]